jgi:hypothetical protein
LNLDRESRGAEEREPSGVRTVQLYVLLLVRALATSTPVVERRFVVAVTEGRCSADRSRQGALRADDHAEVVGSESESFVRNQN